MSTVVADARTGVMMADKQMSYHASTVTKLFKVVKSDGTWLLGGAGPLLELLDFVRWFDGPEDARPPTFEGDNGGLHILMMGPDKALWLFRDSTTPIQLEEEFFSVGSGSDYAMGALEAGASIKRALAIAAKRDPHTNTSTTMFKLPKRT